MLWFMYRQGFDIIAYYAGKYPFHGAIGSWHGKKFLYPYCIFRIDKYLNKHTGSCPQYKPVIAISLGTASCFVVLRRAWKHWSHIPVPLNTSSNNPPATMALGIPKKHLMQNSRFRHIVSRRFMNTAVQSLFPIEVYSFLKVPFRKSEILICQQ